MAGRARRVIGDWGSTRLRLFEERGLPLTIFAVAMALQRHPEAKRWERFVAEAGLVDRIAKGRADGDPWLALERLLVAVSEARAVRLLARA